MSSTPAASQRRTISAVCGCSAAARVISTRRGAQPGGRRGLDEGGSGRVVGRGEVCGHHLVNVPAWADLPARPRPSATHHRRGGSPVPVLLDVDVAALTPRGPGPLALAGRVVRDTSYAAGAPRAAGAPARAGRAADPLAQVVVALGAAEPAHREPVVHGRRVARASRDGVVDVVDAARGGLVLEVREDEAADPCRLRGRRRRRAGSRRRRPRSCRAGRSRRPSPSGVADRPPVAGQRLTVGEREDEGALGGRRR